MGHYVGYTYYVVSIESQRLPFFQSAYDSLKASTYQSLYLQTEGKALLDQIDLVIDDKGLRLGFGALNATLATKAQASPTNATVALAEFIHFSSDSLSGSGWDGAAQLADLLETQSLDAAQTSALTYLQYRFAGGIASSTNTTLNGTGAADGLIGRGGNDTLAGGGGNDVLIGGAGTYVYNCGDALDTVTFTSGANDLIVLGAGKTPGDVSVQLGNYAQFGAQSLPRELVIGFGGNDAQIYRPVYL